MRIFSQNKNFRILEEIREKSKYKRLVRFIIGCFLVAIAYNLFLAPNDIVAGGVGGIAIILNELFKFDYSTVILIGNIILLIVSYIFLGKEKTRGSILGSLVFPICVKLTSDIGTYIDIDNSQLLLSAVFGGVLYGFGAGMIFKAGYTGGGTDILSQLINKYLNEYVHTLGNLTITGYNQNLSNFDFNKKKYRTNSEGKEVGYTNGLYLNKDIVKDDYWSVDKISARTDDLVGKALELFNLNK